MHQYPGYWSAIFSILYPDPNYLIFSPDPNISNAVIRYDFETFFKEPTSRSSFKIRFMEQGIHPALIEAAYCSMSPPSERDMDTFFEVLRIHSKNIDFTKKPYPFQVDGIFYPDPAEFKVIKTAFYYHASQYPWASPQYIDSV